MLKLNNKNSYSQYREDRIINDFFLSQMGANFQGTVLDIGANDGITLSNSCKFISQGWKADLVEPSPKAFIRLKKKYISNSNVQLYNVAIGNNETITLYESGSFLTLNDIALLSTLIPKELEKWKPYKTQFNKVTVQSISFDYLKKLSPYKQWDFISIDAEGMDLHILKQINLTDVGCRCLCIEYNGLQKEEFVAYAKLHGMFLHWINNVNLIFIK